MIVFLGISSLDDIVEAIAELPADRVVRPQPAVRVGEPAEWEGTRIVHWTVVGRPLVEIVRHYNEDGTLRETTEGAIKRGYAIKVDGGRWAIVGVDANGEMYEEAIAMVEGYL